MSKFKRFLSLVVALVMVIGMVPATVFATEEETPVCEHAYVDGVCTECGKAEPAPEADPELEDETPVEDETPTEGEEQGEPEALAETPTPITGTITGDTTWNDGDVIGGVTIAGNVTITVKGTVTVAGTIRMSPNAICSVTFKGENDAKLIRSGDFTGQMFYVEGVSGNFQNLTFNNITLDGGAVWEGEVDKTLNRGTTNSGVKATGSVLYLVYANADLNNSTLQNHDDSTGDKANAVFLRYYSTIDFNNSVVRNNNSQSGSWRGGVVTVRQGGTCVTNSADVYGNSAASGGFFGIGSSGSFGGIAEAYNSKFHNNYAGNGAVFLMQCNSKIGYLKIDGCEFYDNASKSAVLTEWAYSRPFIISNSYFHDNECAVWDCHTDPVLDLSGKIVIAEDPDYAKYLYETPIVLTGALAEGSSIAMSEASLTKLGGCVIAGSKSYDATAADLAKFVLPAGYAILEKEVDVTNDGVGDTVASKDAGKEITLTLKDSLDSAASAEGVAYSKVTCLPVNPFAHDGLIFAGWVDAQEKVVAKKLFTEATTLSATWKIETPVVTMGRTDAADPYCNTLKVTVTNLYDGITYTYQWYKNDVAIEGATAAEYTITETATYKCVITASREGVASVTASKSGSATFKEHFVAKVGDTSYGTLKAAVEAANAIEGGAIVTLLDDVDATETIAVTGNVTIVGEHTINRGAFTGALFNVDAGATLTLDGGLTIDGNNKWTFNKESYEADLMSMTQVKKKDGGPYIVDGVYKYVTPVAGAPVAADWMIRVVGGTVNLKNVTIQNQFAKNAGIVNADDNTSNMIHSTVVLNGTEIRNIASMENGGVVVATYSDKATITVDNVLIEDNYVGGNHGLFRLYKASEMTMNSGKIVNTRGWNSNGVVLSSYEGSIFTMNGGEICSSSSIWGDDNQRNMAVNVYSGSTVIMNGGTICHNIGKHYAGGIASYKPSSTIIITGGSVVDNVSLDNDNRYGAERGDDVESPGTVVISGGTFGHDVVEYLAPNCGQTYDAETGYYAVTTDIAEVVNGKVYPSVAEAVKNANAGDTVKVLASHKVGETVVIDKNITLDLNDHTLTGKDVYPVIRVQGGADVTVKNGNINNADYIFVLGASDGSSAGNLTIESGAYTGETTVASVTKGTLTINGGEFSVSENEAYDYAYVLNCVDANYKDGSAKIVVKGGKFYKFNPENNAAEGTGTSFVVVGYKAVAEGDYYTVVNARVDVAEVNGTKYETLKEAVDVANAIEGGATVTLLENCTVDATISVTSNVTISGAKTITRAKGFTGTMFAAKNGAVLTFDGVTLDGGAVWAGEEHATLGRGTTNEGIAATGHMVSVEYASAVLKNATVQNQGGVCAAIYEYEGSVELTKCVVYNNYSSDKYHYGGVATMRWASTFIAKDTEFYGNQGTVGGIVGVSSSKSFDAVIRATNCVFRNNYAGSGALFRVQDNKISNNAGDLTLKNCEMYNNGSTKGLIYSHTYGTPVYIIDSNIHDNACSLYDYSSRNPNLFISGNTVIKNTAFRHPIIINDVLGDEASIVMDAASVAKLMNDFGYIASDAKHLVLVDASNKWTYEELSNPYTITDADLEQFSVEGYDSFVRTDVNADNNFDIVPVKTEVTEITLTLVDTLGNKSEEQVIYAEIAALPVCLFENTGFVYAGWNDSEGNAVTKQYFTESTTLYAKWSLDTPAVQINSDSNKLTASVANKSDKISYTYQWYKADAAIEGATGAEYTITESATYKCEVKAVFGDSESIGSASVAAEYEKIAVAQVGETKYFTLEEAIDAANAGADKTIILLTTIVIDKDTSYDFSGLTVKTIATEDGVEMDAFKILANVTITANGGKIDARPSKGYTFYVGDKDGTVGNLTINSGTCYGDTSVAQVTKGKLTINGGNFSATPYQDSYTYTLNCIDANFKDGTAVIEVKGGCFYKYDPANNAAEGKDTDFVAEGYKSEELKLCYFTVLKEENQTYVAEVNGTQYTTLQAAVNAAKDGDTVKVIADHAIDPMTENNNGLIYLQGTDKANLTIDLNGHDITVDTAANTSGRIWSVFYIRYGATVTFTGGGSVTVVGDDTNRPYLFWSSASKIIMAEDAGVFTMDNSKTAGASMGAVSHTFYASSAGNVTINGGTYYNNGPHDILNLRDGSGSSFNINGGFYDEDLLAGQEGSKLIIKDGCTIIKVDDELWGVDAAVARIDKANFGSLEAAFKAVNAEEKIVLLENVAENVSLDKSIELDLNGKSYTGTITLTDAAAELTAVDGLNVTTNVEGKKVAYEDGVYKLIEDATKVTVTVQGATMVEGNALPAFTYKTDVALDFDLDIKYTVDGTTINATVAKMEGYEFIVVPGTLTVQEAVAKAAVNKVTTYFASLQEAYDKADSRVDMLTDIVLTETLKVTRPKTMSIYTNGKNLSGDLATLIEVDCTSGGLTISSSGKITNTGDVFFVNKGNVTIYGACEITSEESNCIYVRGGKTTIQKAKLIANGAYPAIQGNGNYAGDVTISGGSISAPNAAIAIYWPQNGTLSISGGTITGETAVYAKSGKINISGGEFIANGDKVDFQHYSNGAYATGDAVVIEACKDTAYETPKVTISGGTFTSAHAEAVMFYACDTAANAADIMELTGGVYSSMPDVKWCAEGKAPVLNDNNMWEIAEFIATVDDIYYSDWAKAKAAIKGDSTVVLYEDIDNRKGVDGSDGKFSFATNGKTMTLDLNGHTFETTYMGASGHQTVHVMDSAEGGTVNVAEFIGLYANGYMNIDSDVDFNANVQISFQPYQNTGSTGCLLVDGEKVVGRGHFQQEDGIVGTTGGYITIKNNFKEITVNSGNFTINEDFVIVAEQFTIADKATVTVYKNADLTLSAGTVATINGKLQGEGKVVVNTIDQFKTILTTDMVKIELGSAMTLADDLAIDKDVFVTGMKSLTVTGNLALSAGTYDMDVNKYCADGYMAVDNGDGTWTVTTAVAAIGNVKYASLEEAVAAAKAGQTVKLLCNATGAGVVIDKNLTINFNTFTYTVNKATANSCGIEISKDCTKVTLSGGALEVAEGVQVESLIQSAATDVRLNGLKMSGGEVALTATDGKVTLNSQSSFADDYDQYLIRVCDTGIVNVGKNLLPNKDIKTIDAAAYIGNNYYGTLQNAVDAGGTVTVYRDIEAPGVVINNDVNITFGNKTYTATSGIKVAKGVNAVLRNVTIKPADGVAIDHLIHNSGNLSLSYVTMEGVLYCDDGASKITGKTLIEADANNTAVYVVGSANIDIPKDIVATITEDAINAAAKIGTTYYGELEYAAEAATETQTVVVLKDAELTRDVSSVGSLKIGAEYNVDLAGHDLTAKNVTVFGTLIDTTDGTGSVVSGNLWFNGHDNSGYMPLKDGDCYRLFAVVLDNRGVKPVSGAPDKVKAGFTVRFNKVEAYDLMSASVQDGSIKATAIFEEVELTDEKEFTKATIVDHLGRAKKQLVAANGDTSAVTAAFTGTIVVKTYTIDVFAEVFSSNETNVIIGSQVVTYPAP